MGDAPQSALLLPPKRQGEAMKTTALALLIFSLAPSVALACQFDTDCQVGSRCIKNGYSLYGVCAGGLFPGNKNDDQPVYAPLDIDGTYGNTCSFDIDCGISNRCLKSGGSIDGVCVRGR